ncbi:hypothetical protein M9H77_23285 [Catharanthus roseus]|uniref:Uncharacterized protein n=1 Tax=Catharanthus roseus TaxID=4058 RepID=A0ACC0AVE3_CATRO|nr:hypothetical protein M9H77_23285 [Catharanthus roseus]
MLLGGLCTKTNEVGCSRIPFLEEKTMKGNKKSKKWRKNDKNEADGVRGSQAQPRQNLIDDGRLPLPSTVGPDIKNISVGNPTTDSRARPTIGWRSRLRGSLIHFKLCFAEYLELKKEECSRQTIGGLIGAID